jgi:Alginate export
MSNLVDYLEEVSMRRRFFTAFAGVVSFLMIGVMTADAAEITFGGRIRPRYEYWDLKADQSSGGAAATQRDDDASFINMLVRLQATAKIDDNTSAFIQLQGNTRFGNSLIVGPGSPGQPNDSDTDIGFHQAYFTLDKLFGAPLELQVGRQEVILDGHRLFGNTVWTQGMQSHDAVRLMHKHDNMSVMYAFSKAAETALRGDAGGVFAGGGSSDDVDDVDVHIGWANFKGLLGENSSTSAYLVLVDQDKNTGPPPTLGSGDFWTIGARQAGGVGDISYRGEFYYQTGKSNLPAPTGGAGDLDAFMLGLRAGYKAKNVPMKPSLTLWFDYLSGTSFSDAAAGDQSDFRTLFDTGHKFYGLMDLFLGGPTGNGPTHPAAGLVDYAIKLSVQPLANTTLKADLHHFEVAEDDLATGGASGPATLGQEIDLTLVHKYSASTKMVVGYSHFFAADLLSFYNSSSAARINNYEDSDWFYLMFDVMF